MTFAVELSGVSHRHANSDSQSLINISLKVEKGEVLTLIGPSGAGKSTLLALLGGQLSGWQGDIQVLGNPLNPNQPQERKDRIKTGFIFQEFALVERATVLQNVLNGRLGHAGKLASLFGRFSATDIAAVDAALKDAGIFDLATQRVDQISGGQRQRVAIARCLAQMPSLILADEPVSNLDPTRAEGILKLITDPARDKASKRETTVIFTSHQPELALRFASRVAGLKAGQIVFDCAAADLDSAMIDALYEGETNADTYRQAS